MEHEGEQTEIKAEQPIAQQEVNNENEATAQDSTNNTGKANSDEEEIKADPAVSDEQSKLHISLDQDFILCPLCKGYYFCIIFVSSSYSLF